RPHRVGASLCHRRASRFRPLLRHDERRPLWCYRDSHGLSGEDGVHVRKRRLRLRDGGASARRGGHGRGGSRTRQPRHQRGSAQMTTTTEHVLARRVPGLLVSAGLIVIAVVFFFPMAWMVLSSFKTNQEIFSTPFSLPTGIDFSQWVEAWEVGHVG